MASSERVSGQGRTFTSVQNLLHTGHWSQPAESAPFVMFCRISLGGRGSLAWTLSRFTSTKKELLANSPTVFIVAIKHVQREKSWQAGGAVNPLHSLCTKPSLQLVWMKMSRVEWETEPNHSETKWPPYHHVDQPGMIFWRRRWICNTWTNTKQFLLYEHKRKQSPRFQIIRKIWRKRRQSEGNWIFMHHTNWPGGTIRRLCC